MLIDLGPRPPHCDQCDSDKFIPQKTRIAYNHQLQLGTNEVQSTPERLVTIRKCWNGHVTEVVTDL